MLSNQAIADFLRNIPQSNEDKKSLQNTYHPSDNPTQIAALYGIVKVLNMLGVVCLEEQDGIAESLIRASSQTAKYTLMSFADYFERNETLIEDWKTRGIQDNVLANGASFLQVLEQERLKRFEDTAPTRYVKVAQVLIKRINPITQAHEFLFQFDKNANQYQLIGGRWSERDGDDLKTTIIREIEEELPLNNLLYPDAYEVNTLIENLTVAGTISTTFGALTHYTFSIYHMTGLRHNLKLLPEDYWVPISMILDGVVTVDKIDYPFTGPEIYQRMDQSIDGGLRGLPVSFIESVEQH